MGRRNVTYRENVASTTQKKHRSDAPSSHITLGPLVTLRPHSTTPTSTPTPIPTCPTRLRPYVRHARFPREDPREDVGVGVVECSLYRARRDADSTDSGTGVGEPCSRGRARRREVLANECSSISSSSSRANPTGSRRR